MQQPSYHSIEARMKSFDGAKISPDKVVFWPHSAPTPIDLAKAGFYFTPKPENQDLVTCYLCNIPIDNWGKITTSPTATHFKQSEKCPLANLTADGKNGEFMRLKTFFRFIESCNDIEMLLNRSESMWPHDGTNWMASSTAMASAGFYYAPNEFGEDYGLCPFCGLGLDSWEPKDEPIKEHTHKSPKCRFVQAFQKNPAVVERAAEKHIKKNTPQKRPKRTAALGFKQKKRKIVSNIPVMLEFKAKGQEITSQVFAPKSVNRHYLTPIQQQIKNEKKIPGAGISLNVRRFLNPIKSGNDSLEHATKLVPELVNKDAGKTVLHSITEKEVKLDAKSKVFLSESKPISASQSVPEQPVLNRLGMLIAIPNPMNSDDYKNEFRLEPAYCIINPDIVFDIVGAVKSIPLSDKLKDFTVRKYLAYLADEAEAKVKDSCDKLIEKIKGKAAKAVQTLEKLPVKVEKQI
jgi:hypothetical protein